MNYNRNVGEKEKAMSKKAGIWLISVALLALAAGPAIGQEFVE